MGCEDVTVSVDVNVSGPQEAAGDVFKGCFWSSSHPNCLTNISV